MTDETDKVGADLITQMLRYNTHVVTVVQGPDDWARIKAMYSPTDKDKVVTKEQVGEDNTKNKGHKNGS